MVFIFAPRGVAGPIMRFVAVIFLVLYAAKRELDRMKEREKRQWEIWQKEIDKPVKDLANHKKKE